MCILYKCSSSASGDCHTTLTGIVLQPRFFHDNINSYSPNDFTPVSSPRLCEIKPAERYRRRESGAPAAADVVV